MSWYTPDVLEWFAAQRQQHEQTAGANVGAFPVPLGPGVLRRAMPEPAEDDYLIPDEYKDVYGKDKK